MASIRNLKKDLNYIAFELLTEAFAYKHFHNEMKEEKFDTVIANIIKLRNEAIAAINKQHDFETVAAKREHFRKIRSNMIEMAGQLEELGK